MAKKMSLKEASISAAYLLEGLPKYLKAAAEEVQQALISRKESDEACILVSGPNRAVVFLRDKVNGTAKATRGDLAYVANLVTRRQKKDQDPISLDDFTHRRFVPRFGRVKATGLVSGS